MGPGRYLKMILRPVASFSQSMSPWRATATHFMPEMTSFFRTCTSQITYFVKLSLIFCFLRVLWAGNPPSKKMRIEILRGGYGGLYIIISHRRLNYIGFCWFQETIFWTFCILQTDIIFCEHRDNIGHIGSCMLRLATHHDQRRSVCWGWGVSPLPPAPPAPLVMMCGQT